MYVQRWQEKQKAVKEESLTDWLLYSISEATPKATYKGFTRHQEARKTGADWEWEWWFVTNKGGLKLRVQAKKAPGGGKNLYSGIAHSNKYGLQIDMLRADAKANNALALYAFFSDVDAPNLCSNGLRKQGVYLATAKRIYDDFVAKGPKKVIADQVLAVSAPLPCFACCATWRSPAAIHDIFSIALDLSEQEALPGVHLNIPEYVYELMSSSEERLSRVRDLYPSENLDVDGVFVLDFRDLGSSE
jgi:hypothetical protein